MTRRAVPTVVVYARVPYWLADALKDEAASEARSVAGMLRIVLEERYPHDVVFGVGESAIAVGDYSVDVEFRKPVDPATLIENSPRD